jgi:predicted XRE-type DNA-binding protein
MGTMAELAKLDPLEVAEKILEAHPGESDWLDEFAEALDRRRAERALERILQVWGLNQSEAAHLFGVTRQAMSKWLERGIPSERVQAIGDLAAATDLLVRHVRRDRIPAVVRRPAAALDGQSLVDLVAAFRTREVLEACRSMFDFERAHA